MKGYQELPSFGKFVTEVLIFRNSRSLMFFKISVLRISQHVLALAGLLLQNNHCGCFWIFAAANFSAESGIYCWQSHRLLLRTPLKTGLKPQKQPLGLFCKKGVLWNFANFTGNQLCWSLYLIELQAFRPAALLKRDSGTDVFLRNLENF